MKRIVWRYVFLALLLVISIAAFSVSAIFLYNKHAINSSLIKNNGDYVVLLHGLGRTSFSMQKIGKELAKSGYKVINIGYPTRSDTIPNLVENSLKPVLNSAYTDETKKINFVTHSMGGIMVRYYLAHNTVKNLGRVVMLAPPNKGSEAADTWSNYAISRYILGPSLVSLTTKPDSLVNTLPKPNYDVAVIAGTFDEKVSIEKTKLEGAQFVEVANEHTWIMTSKAVISNVITFLKTGVFNLENHTLPVSQRSTSTNKTSVLFPPLTKFNERVTKKPFGVKISPASSTVTPERFSGYHTGVDFEIFPDEEHLNVPVFAICNGPLLIKKWARGYGGMLVQKCDLQKEPITVVYGHVRIASIDFAVGDTLTAGERVGVLGTGFSEETDGERKHLHLGIHKGTALITSGYVNTGDQLKNWYNILEYIK